MPSPVSVLEAVVFLIVLYAIRFGHAPSWLVGGSPDADDLAAAREHNRLLEEDLDEALARVDELEATQDDRPTLAMPPLSGTFDERNDVLRERARADDLARRLVTLQEYNFAADQQIHSMQAELAQLRAKVEAPA